jgi:hypothetical protein
MWPYLADYLDNRTNDEKMDAAKPGAYLSLTAERQQAAHHAATATAAIRQMIFGLLSSIVHQPG